MKLRAKIILGFSCVIFILTIILIFSSLYAKRINDQLNERATLSFQLQESVQEARSTIQEIHSDVMDTILFGKNDRTEAIDTLNKKAISFYKLIDELIDNGHGKSGLLEEVRRVFRAYYVFGANILKLPDVQAFRNREDMFYLFKNNKAEMIRIFEVILVEYRKDLDQSLIEMREAARLANTITFSLIALGSVLAITLALIISGFLVKPIRELVDKIELISAGDLDQKVKIQTHDEIGTLGSAFNKMASQLKESFDQIREYNRLLEEKVKELGELDKLKDEFLANTSHELRTPLHGIIGIAESLVDSANDYQKTSKSAGIIVRSARRLNLLINDILDSASLKAQTLQLKTTPVALNRSAALACEVIGSIAKQKSLRVQNRISDTDIIVEADEERLQQIFLNLLGNALKFTSDGEIEISAVRKEKLVEIAVQDTGPGIDPEKEDKIFDLFEKGDLAGNATGTGLGLAITKSLVQLHGGDIWLDKNTTVGTRFVFTLPISEKKLEEQEPIPVIHSETSTIPIEYEDGEEIIANINAPSILIVDDDPVNLQVLRTQLAPKGFSLEFVTSAGMALKRLEEKKPDLILLDVMMPEMDGFDFCRTVRTNHSLINLPIIFLTAKTQLHDIIKGFLCGGNDYLPKPFAKEELNARIRTQLQLVNARNRLLSLCDFSNRIGSIQDTDKLTEFVFDTACSNLPVKKAALFQGNKLLKSFGENSKELATLSNGEQEQETCFTMEEGRFIKVKVRVNEQYSAVLQGEEAFDELDKVYVRNLIDQLKITQQNLQFMINDPKKLEALSCIANNHDRILYIQSERNYCSIVMEDDQEISELQRIPLKGIKLYFPDDSLLQVHRSYLINPAKNWSLSPLSRSRYNLTIGETTIPVGKSYLKMLNKIFPQFQV